LLASFRQGCGNGFSNLVVLVFSTKKNFKSSKVQILGFFVFFLKKNLKNTDFRLTVTSESCYRSV